MLGLICGLHLFSSTMVWFLICSSLVSNMQAKWLGLPKYPTTSCSTETRHPIRLYSRYVHFLHILFRFTLHEACDHIQCYLFANLDSTNDNVIGYDSLILGLQHASEMAGPPQVPNDFLQYRDSTPHSLVLPLC